MSEFVESARFEDQKGSEIEVMVISDTLSDGSKVFALEVLFRASGEWQRIWKYDAITQQDANEAFDAFSSTLQKTGICLNMASRR